jgi:hypothetical protein
MANQKIYECEVKKWVNDPTTGKRVREWIVMPVERALQLADVSIRCKKCHGGIRLHKAGPNGIPRAHAEHRQRHRGCPLGDCFDGEFRLSPTALEF